MEFETKTLLRPSIALWLGAFAIILFIALDTSSDVGPLATSWPQDSPDEFAAYFQGIRTAEGESAPSYGPGYRLSAYEQLQSAAKGQSATILPWLERGPGNVAGRTRAILVDMLDATRSTWIVGSVAGGIWRTTDKGLSWASMTDHLPRLSIGALAQAASKPAVMYAGTGEGYPNGDAAVGDGIFKSVNGGLTWVPLASTVGSYNFLFVNRIIVSPTDDQFVIAATNDGIYRSGNGGVSWTAVKAAGTSSGFYQVLFKPGDFSTQYAVEKARGIWKSIDSGSTWVLMNTGLPESTSNVRIELDISITNPNRLVALVENKTGPDPLYFSDNGAANWSLFSPTNTGTAIDIAGDQGWYDLAVKIHPFNPDIVFLGGVNLYRANVTGSSIQSQFTVNQNGTTSFLSFINFGGGQLGGGLRLGTDEPESTITPEKMVPVGVRFGPGKSQMAHRFVPPDQAGVAFSTYPYRNYVAVPFEVWDTKNNRQLMVSFRDRNDNGRFDLIANTTENVGREYVIIHAVPYEPETPHPSIARNGGIVTDLAYFFWPTLAPGAIWDPTSLPVSKLEFFWVNVPSLSGSITQIGTGVHADQHIIIASPSAGTEFELLVGNDGGISYSGDGGANWIDRDRGYNTTQYYGIDKKPGLSVYVGGTQDNGSWRSFGDPTPSQFWQNAGSGDGFDAVWHKQNDQKILTTSQWNWIQRSVNGGQSWTSASSGITDTGTSVAGAQFLTILAQDPTNSENVYTVGRSGVWRTTDFASSWSLSSIAPESWGFDEVVRSAKITVSLKSPNVVWAGAEMDAVPSSGTDKDGKLQLSTDKGVTFSSVPTPSIAPGRLSGLATSFEGAETVYVLFSASNRAKILRSTDSGQSWKDLSGFDPGPDGLISQNGFPDVSVYDLLDFPNSTRLWAATEIGLIESLNDGATWSIANNGLPAVSIWQIRKLDDEIVLATHGRGIWTVPASSIPPVSEIFTNVEPVEAPIITSLETIFPNPVQSRAVLKWNSAESSRARVSIVNIQGREVATVFDGTVGSGPQETVIDAVTLPAGAYFIRMEVGNRILTKSFVRMR
ncbi:MAG: T9SS type A sorting domain-containing protein [Bacteroidetes bacterium]|nr:T9SS type A sorting domain-containing protein [Bacteroidota bacterium]